MEISRFRNTISYAFFVYILVYILFSRYSEYSQLNIRNENLFSFNINNHNDIRDIYNYDKTWNLIVWEPWFLDNYIILNKVFSNILYTYKYWLQSEPLLIKHYKDQRNINLTVLNSTNQIDFNNYILQDQKYNKFHMYWIWNEWNVKYLWINWKQEFIYNSETNKFDYSDINGATYNYWTNIITHTILDTIPYYLFWNSINDPTSIFDRIIQTLK